MAIRYERGRTPSGVAYSVAGDGPPLLWLTGYAMPAPRLERLAGPLASDHRCIIVDHRGSGRSQTPLLMPLTTTRMAKDAIAVLRHLDERAAHVVGVSLGGMVAQELAIRAPHRVRTLILVSTTPGGRRAAVPSCKAILGTSSRVLLSHHDAWRINVPGAWHQAWAAATHDAEHRLGEISAPTLVLHGNSDPVVPSVNAKVLEKRIPGAELRIVRGAGHLALFESRTARDTLRAWLTTHRHTAQPRGSSVSLAVRRSVRAPALYVASQSLPLRRAAGWAVRAHRVLCQAAMQMPRRT